MKLFLLILSIFTGEVAYLQMNKTNRVEDPAYLAKVLTGGLESDKEKVRVIFRWITDNISYMVKSNQKIMAAGLASQKFLPEDIDDGSPLKSLNDRVAEGVLKKREAICNGYARLFSALCSHAGIQSEVIVGYARGGNSRSASKFSVNHTWNTVFLDGRWQLLDASWASGYISRDRNEFIRDYDAKYFLSDPRFFITDHFPDDPRWTLLPDAEVPDEFRHTPFKQKSFAKYKIISFTPSTGVINARVGDTILLELETGDEQRDKQISPDCSVDSALFRYSSSWVFLKPAMSEKQSATTGQYKYIYPITSTEAKWLYLMYNDDMVLRYRLNVK